ncbi:type IV pilus modification protein PilV [Nevskia sp.]|uniref:type IV pilus modification protein PilV n=1 Tax=Nevskia sp. TaxID=1929292 RepID=UPI0025FF93F3|nr:type IV pilus modification protein PilV [Nevskia sp.]
MSRLRTAERGVGLVEVLVATVLVSIGLLTLASLQALSLKRSTSAALRTEAVGQSYDLLDRMRANRAQAIGGLYNLAFANAPTGSTLASADLSAWKAALDASLPEGDGQVRVEAQVVTITVRWRDTGVADDAEPAVVNLRTQL